MIPFRAAFSLGNFGEERGQKRTHARAGFQLLFANLSLYISLQHSEEEEERRAVQPLIGGGGSSHGWGRQRSTYLLGFLLVGEGVLGSSEGPVVGEMQMDARVGALNAGHGGGAAAVDGGAARIARQQQQQGLQPQIGTWQHLLAGGVAGAVSKTCTAPLARLTILFQVQGMHSDVATLKRTSIFHEASRIVREEGVRAFWKGNLVTIAHRLPYSSISFYAYERYKLKLQSLPGLDRHREFVAADVFLRLLGGGLAGITAASITYPLDLVRTRLAAQLSIGHGECSIVMTPAQAPRWTAKATVQGYPPRRNPCQALYHWGEHLTFRRMLCIIEEFRMHFMPFAEMKGSGDYIRGVGPNIAISFSVYEKLRSNWQLRRPDDNAPLVSLACGSLSGIASSTVTFPLDLVRRRMQLEGAAGRARIYNKGLFATFGQIIRTEGIRGLYRGILPEYFKVIPSIGIVFLTYESLKTFLLARIQ
ncbi:hypothetical protein Taro_006062 [Colocasia esculenta]|uniref:Mitochondrial carrier protein n=1 Tax=Colocasia esculenta TaxID=4460 RepID=A0A843TRH3_COLES|nr:hypothetical protein [Colocasia esculenta]